MLSLYKSRDVFCNQSDDPNLDAIKLKDRVWFTEIRDCS